MAPPLLPDVIAGFEAAGVGHAVVRRDGTIEYCSDAFSSLTGIVCEEACRRRLPWFSYDPAPPHVKDQRAALWAEFIRSGTVWRGTVKWFLPGGATRYFEGTAIPQADDRILLVTNDHTARIEAYRSLRTRERNQQQVINDLPISLCLFDQHATVILANPYIPQRLGLIAEELPGQRASDAFGPDLDPLTEDLVAQLAADSAPIEGRGVSIKHGPLAGTHWLVFGRALISEDPERARLMVLAVDRTDSIRLREERRRFAEAIHETQKIAALNDFAGNLAHELSNLLHPVGAYARLLAAEPDHEARAAYAKKINKGAMTAGRILRRTLSMARLDPSEIGPVDLSAVVRETVGSAEDLAPEGLTYHAHLPETPIIGFTQEGELRQVLLNLLNNAAEAMHYRGRITVSLREGLPLPDDLDVVPSGHPPFAEIVVADTGPGMTPSVRERIFDPFFTTKPSGRGTGLGLPVVQGLVTGWGGMVRASSAEGEGAEFQVLIPQREAAVN